MPLGDIGIFLPSETQYTTPGAYDTLLKAEATKKASYLASMDQFYEQLGESQRQFDETLGFKREELGQQATLTRESIQAQKEMHTASLASAENVANIQARGSQEPIELGGPSAWDYFNLAEEYVTGGSGAVRDPRFNDLGGYNLDFTPWEGPGVEEEEENSSTGRAAPESLSF